jgi:hypothetical protein
MQSLIAVRFSVWCYCYVTDIELLLTNFKALPIDDPNQALGAYSKGTPSNQRTRSSSSAMIGTCQPLFFIAEMIAIV